MNKIFLDTNVVIDLMLARQPHYAFAEEVFELIDRKEVVGIVSAVSVPTIYYLICKVINHQDALKFIEDLLSMVSIVEVDKTILDDALRLKDLDYEDNIQIICAHLAKADYIITRDLSHFKHAHIPVLSPYQYLKLK